MGVPRYIFRPRDVGGGDVFYQIVPPAPIFYDVSPDEIQSTPISRLVYCREVYVIYGREYEIFKLTEFPPGTEIEENEPEELIRSLPSYFNRLTNRTEYAIAEDLYDYDHAQMVERAMGERQRQELEYMRQEAMVRMEIEIRRTAQQVLYQEKVSDFVPKDCRTCGHSDGRCILGRDAEKHCRSSPNRCFWWDRNKGIKPKYKRARKEKIRFIRLEDGDATGIL